MTKQVEDSKFIECECMGEGLLITDDSESKLIYLAMFGYGVGYRPKPSVMERLKYAINHLRSGKYYDDELVLTHGRAKEMVEHINKIIDES